jgi:CRISPR-associated protein Cas1
MVVNMAILYTHKEGIRYLEHCKIIVNDEKLTYLRKESAVEKHYSIPYANLGVILLGQGTSITQKAARFLSSKGVMLGFTGTGASPLFLASQDEYRPTEYFHSYIKIWTCESSRLEAAKIFQIDRVANIKYTWRKIFDDDIIDKLNIITNKYLDNVSVSNNQNQILTSEARFTKDLYRILAIKYNTKFSREHSTGVDQFNRNLDFGNYLAYGLGSLALWSLGIPASLSVLHGKTRRGGLVFDAADIIKDSFIMPIAFKSASEGLKNNEFRNEIIAFSEKHKALDKIFKTLKRAIDDVDNDNK